jgi:[ribosomal protein S5]-alanine N-acetyltransferase
MQTITTPMLTLEPQRAAHAAEMFAVLSDPAIYEFENAPPVSLEWLHIRFTKLESRQSGDGHEKWLNWVIRLPSNALIGYVQATVFDDGRALIAYELASAHWRRGLGTLAVETMLAELKSHYSVSTFAAVLKRENYRSLALLETLKFSLGDEAQRSVYGAEDDELLMLRAA